MSSIPSSATHEYEIYFDLSCHLCYLDALWLMRQPFASKFKVVNFRAGEQGSTFPAIPAADLEKQLHMVRRSTGETFTGIQAIIEILRLSPRWIWASFFLRLRGVYPLAWLIYRAFAQIRLWLPKRKSCQWDPPSNETAINVKSDES